MPGRSYVSSMPYRYGLMGNEGDSELKGQGNSYDFGARIYDPRLGKFLSVDPATSKLPNLSPYSFANNNPILFVDVNGEYPIYIHVRSFAPFDVFGGNNWVGDGSKRPFSSQASYTSRLRQVTAYETTSHTYYTQYYGSTSIGLRDPILGLPISSKSEAGGKPEFSTGTLFTKTHLYGNDDAIIPGMDGTFAENLQSPDIDVHNTFFVNEEKDEFGNGMLNISGTMTGDAFPAAEAFVKDAKGTAVFLGVSPAQYGPSTGPFIGLWGDSQRNMGSYDVSINVDADGNFLGVTQGETTYSPAAWNKQFEEKSPKEGAATETDY